MEYNEKSDQKNVHDRSKHVDTISFGKWRISWGSEWAHV